MPHSTVQSSQQWRKDCVSAGRPYLGFRGELGSPVYLDIAYVVAYWIYLTYAIL